MVETKRYTSRAIASTLEGSFPMFLRHDVPFTYDSRQPYHAAMPQSVGFCDQRWPRARIVGKGTDRLKKVRARRN
jgi:hypothetical protein